MGKVDGASGLGTVDTMPAPPERDAPPTPVVLRPQDYVYALGQIEPRFPSLSIEKEFAQATAGDDTSGFTDRQAMKTLAGARSIVDVIFSYAHRQTDVVEKYFVRIDVTEMYPFLVSKMSPYYDVSR